MWNINDADSWELQLWSTNLKVSFLLHKYISPSSAHLPAQKTANLLPLIQYFFLMKSFVFKFILKYVLPKIALAIIFCINLDVLKVISWHKHSSSYYNPYLLPANVIIWIWITILLNGLTVE